MVHASDAVLRDLKVRAIVTLPGAGNQEMYEITPQNYDDTYVRAVPWSCQPNIIPQNAFIKDYYPDDRIADHGGPFPAYLASGYTFEDYVGFGVNKEFYVDGSFLFKIQIGQHQANTSSSLFICGCDKKNHPMFTVADSNTHSISPANGMIYVSAPANTYPNEFWIDMDDFLSFSVPLVYYCPQLDPDSVFFTDTPYYYSAPFININDLVFSGGVEGTLSSVGFHIVMYVPTSKYNWRLEVGESFPFGDDEATANARMLQYMEDIANMANEHQTLEDKAESLLGPGGASAMMDKAQEVMNPDDAQVGFDNALSGIDSSMDGLTLTGIWEWTSDWLPATVLTLGALCLVVLLVKKGMS